MKLIDLPDYTKKYKIKGYDVKKVKNEYYLYKIDHYRVPTKNYPVVKSIYIGKIDKEKGLIKANTQKNEEVIAYLEYGLSDYLFRKFKRSLQRTLYGISGEIATKTIKIGIIYYIFNYINLEALKSSYLTYFDAEILLDFCNSNKQISNRALKIKNKIDKLFTSIFYNESDKNILLSSLRNMNALILPTGERINTVPSNTAKDILAKYGASYE